MNEESQVLELFGIPFNVGNCLSGLVSALIVFWARLFWFSRRLQMKPKGKQKYDRVDDRFYKWDRQKLHA